MPTTNDPTIIYWDSCVFLAWLKDEDRPGTEMADLASVVEEIGKNNFHLITSVTTKIEVLPKRSGENVITRFNELFKQKNVDAVIIDERIANKASEIREYYIEESKRTKERALGFADTLHLATAIIREASIFHTFDDGKSNNRSLLKLDGNVAGHPLKIEKPHTRQGTFDFQKHQKSKD